MGKRTLTWVLAPVKKGSVPGARSGFGSGFLLSLSMRFMPPSNLLLVDSIGS